MNVSNLTSPLFRNDNHFNPESASICNFRNSAMRYVSVDAIQLEENWHRMVLLLLKQYHITAWQFWKETCASISSSLYRSSVGGGRDYT